MTGLSRKATCLVSSLLCAALSGISIAAEPETSFGKPILIKGLKAIPLDSPDSREAEDTSQGLSADKLSVRPLRNRSSAPSAAISMLPMATAPQVQSAATQQAAPPMASAPGTDSANYVPGSTVDQFRTMRAFQIGKVLFRPSARLSYYYESNLVTSPAPDVSVHAYALEPTVEAFIPLTGNGIRMDYSLAFREFDGFDLRNRVSHYANADSQINISPILNIAVREHFALTTLDSFEFVPGREVIFADAQFRRNSLSTQLNWELSDSNSLGLKADWNRVNFDEVASSGTFPFYDYDQYNFGGFYRRDLTQRSALFVNASYLRDVTDDPRNLTTSKGVETVVGVESAITPLMSGQFSVGFRSLRYKNARVQDFDGAVLRGNLQKELTRRIRIGVAGVRTTHLSNFEQNTYYVTQGIGFTYQHELRSNLTLAVMPGYQRNSYPLTLLPRPGIPSKKRVDRIFDLTVAARYRLTGFLGIEARYDLIERDSDLPEFGFTNYRAGVSLLIGQRGFSRGRTPY